MAARRPIRLPKQWANHVKSGILHAISLASVALSYARGRATTHHQLRAQFDQANTEIALLREGLSIKDARWRRSHTRRRPHYTLSQRMRLLQLRAARGWTLETTAHAFLIDLQTLLSWMRRLGEHGERGLIQTVEPVNRHPDFVRNLVRQRSGGPGDEPEITTRRRRVVARYPGHPWHVDLIVVPTKAGFWVPWFPFSLP